MRHRGRCQRPLDHCGTLFTEGLGGVEQRLRDRLARLGIYPPLPTGSSANLAGKFIADIP